MKHTKWIPKYSTEINELTREHAEALLALYIDAYDEGMRIGKRNALVGVSIAAIIGTIGLCIAGVTYLEHRKQL